MLDTVMLTIEHGGILFEKKIVFLLKHKVFVQNCFELFYKSE